MDSIELEPTSGFQPVQDPRPRMDEPPPVRIVAVEDVRLPALAGIESELDAFYVGLWQFERERPFNQLIYRAENVRLKFEIAPDPSAIDRGTLRPTGIELTSLSEAELKLIEAEHEYIRQRGLTPGQQSLLLQDPAGNWIELFEVRRLG